MKQNLTKKEIERYSRQIVLKDVGASGQKKITKSKVLIVGSGGLGCPIADSLSRAGIGNIGIVDFDKVHLSNIHRQSIFNTNDIGKYKTLVIKNRINLINPLVKVKILSSKVIFKQVISMKTKKMLGLVILWSIYLPIRGKHVEDLVLNIGKK